MASDDLVAIGQVLGAFGIRGEVKVYPLTDFPERFLTTRRVYLGGRETQATLASARPHERVWLLTLAGIDTRAAAEQLKGVYLMVPEQETMPLAEGSYYVFDLVGCDVFSDDGTKLGEVRDALTGTGNDLLVILRPGGGESLVPFARRFVKEVDIERKRLVLDLIPGLFE
ncbi:MAG: ribosome maturation factor RimM [Bacillota bacterium]|nr:ribosome maturation factor RimM [Bacillota bacterium]